MKNSKTLVSFLVGLSLIACAKTSYQAVNGSGGDDPGSQKVPVDNTYSRPQCEINYWDQSIDLNLWDYEFVGSDGGVFGFDKLGPLNLLDLSFKVDKAKLYMKVLPSNPYERNADFDVAANDTDVQFGVKVGFGDIAVGFNHYSNTPVAKMIYSALSKAVEGIKASTTKKEWSTRVLKSPLEQRDRVVIQAGADAGITEGDEFEVWDVTYNWVGAPCASGFSGMSFPEKPIATLRAMKGVDSARQFAVLKITDERISNTQILPGSYVRQVPPAKGKKLKQLGRSIKVNSVVSGDLLLKDGRKVDLVKYINFQVSDAIQDKKWKGLFYRYSDK
jgi:hypothetical protein